MKRLASICSFILLCALSFAQPASRESFNHGWTFSKDGGCRRILDLPHDWGVEGDFSQEYPGETGKLAWWGHASYTNTLSVSAEDLEGVVRLEVDGAMSNAKVYVNGLLAGGWPYGYSSWALDITSALHEGENTIEIVLDNPEESSRWYPGGGIYRNVWISRVHKVSVAHWGTFVKVKEISGGKATLQIVTTVATGQSEPVNVLVSSIVTSPDGETRLAAIHYAAAVADGQELIQELDVPSPELWSPESPRMYSLETEVGPLDGNLNTVYRDRYITSFGIRQTEWKADGFYLNGFRTFLKGVCLHHDAGALGAAWHNDAWIRRLERLRSMGCNAIRCSHNPPAPELLDLCDRMGFLIMDELTDTWTYSKKPNGYATLFDEWAEKDLVAMIHRDRNHPSVILWSIGNECGEQGDASRWWIPQMLTDICHREDSSRLVTAGNDNPWAAFQPYAGTIDVYGFNYKPHLYQQFRDSHPGHPFIGSETASCISTRGYYLFPVSDEKDGGWIDGAPFQVSSYDLYAPAWASKPDYEWHYEDEVPECAGEFVWTGYDYLGEPTPYNLDMSILSNFHTEEERQRALEQFAAWGQHVSSEPLPSRSSYFGIMDLAGFPKDRFWLYQARWRPELPMAHILPHWTWPGREGEITPVHVYTSGDEAELFLNGRSLGRRGKDGGYRIVWEDVRYEPGTLEVVAYKDGRVWARDRVVTAEKPKRLRCSIDYSGDELVYVTIDVVDRHGNIVPTATPMLEVAARGDAVCIGLDAGDPTSHLPFAGRGVRAFAGRASAIVRRTGEGKGTLVVKSAGFRTAKIDF